MTITPVEGLAEIMERLALIDGAPSNSKWEIQREQVDGSIIFGTEQYGYIGIIWNALNAKNNAEFIAHAPDDMRTLLAALAAHEQAEAALREAAQPLMEDYDAYLEGKASGDVHWHDLFWEWASAWRDHERLSDSIEKLYVLYKQGGNDDD